MSPKIKVTILVTSSNPVSRSRRVTTSAGSATSIAQARNALRSRPHHGSSFEAVASHVTDRKCHSSGRQDEYVVPISADGHRGSGQIPGRHPNTGNQRKCFREERALKCLGYPPLVFVRSHVQGWGGSFRNQLKELHVRFAELTRDERPHMQYTEDLAADEQRYADHRADTLRSEDGVQNVLVVHTPDHERVAFSRDASRESLAHRDPDPLLDLLLEPLRGSRDEIVRPMVQQEHGRRVHLEDVADSDQQLIEEVLRGEVGQSNVRHSEQPAQSFGRAANLQVSPDHSSPSSGRCAPENMPSPTPARLRPSRSAVSGSIAEVQETARPGCRTVTGRSDRQHA